jgi:type IV fimbrial biogenesis protein FimT
MKKAKGLRGDQGFTMVEVLVVMVILTILMGMAIPGFIRWLPNYRLRGAARDLYSNLQLAKAGAIKERAEWAVKFTPGTNSYQIISGGADRIYSTTGDNVPQKKVTLPDYGSGVCFGFGDSTKNVSGGAHTTTVTFASNEVVFNSRGTIAGTTGGYAYIQNNRNTAFVVGTWPSGAVVLRRWFLTDTQWK